MNRKVSAVVIWGIAVIVFASMTFLVSPPLRGTAGRTLPPEPPPVGACGKMLDTGFAVVDCASAHTVEVAYSVGAVGPSLSYGFCADRAREYVGSPASGDDDSYPAGTWSLPLRYASRLAAGPGTGSYPGWSWRACLVSPIGPVPWSGYLSSVRNLNPTTRPAALRPCFTRSQDNLAVVSCTQPHRGEIIGVQVILPHAAAGSAPPGLSGSGFDDDGLGDGLSDDELTGGGNAAASEADVRASSCRRSAADFTGVTDPTYAGQLRVVVLPGPGTPLRGPLSASTGAYYGSDVGQTWLLCTLETVVDTQLIESIANWGDRALPLG